MEPGIYKIIGRINDSSIGSPGWSPSMDSLIGAIFTISISIPGLAEAQEHGIDTSRYGAYCKIGGYYRRKSWTQKIASIT